MQCIRRTPSRLSGFSTSQTQLSQRLVKNTYLRSILDLAQSKSRLAAGFTKFDNYVERFNRRMKKYAKKFPEWADTADKSTPILFQEAVLEKLKYVRSRNNKRCLGIAALFGGLIALDYVWCGGIGLFILMIARLKHNSGPFYNMLCFDFYHNFHDEENPRVLVFDYTHTRIINVKEIKAITDPNAAYTDLMKKIKDFENAKCKQESVELADEQYETATLAQRLLRDNLKIAERGFIPPAESFMLDMKMHGDLCLMKFMEAVMNQPRNDTKNPYDITLEFIPNDTIWVFFFLHEPTNSPLMCAIALETVRYIDPDKLMQVLTGGKWTRKVDFESEPTLVSISSKQIGSGLFGDGPTIEGTNAT
jgi:hypothetical protein